MTTNITSRFILPERTVSGRSFLPERTVSGRSFLPERTFAARRTRRSGVVSRRHVAMASSTDTGISHARRSRQAAKSCPAGRTYQTLRLPRRTKARWEVLS